MGYPYFDTLPFLSLIHIYLSVYLLYQILRIEFELQPALSGTDVDIGELQAGFVNIGRERLFHADRRTTAADIPPSAEAVPSSG